MLHLGALRDIDFVDLPLKFPGLTVATNEAESRPDREQDYERQHVSQTLRARKCLPHQDRNETHARQKERPVP